MVLPTKRGIKSAATATQTDAAIVGGNVDNSNRKYVYEKKEKMS